MGIYLNLCYQINPWSVILLIYKITSPLSVQKENIYNDKKANSGYITGRESPNSQSTFLNFHCHSINKTHTCCIPFHSVKRAGRFHQPPWYETAFLSWAVLLVWGPPGTPSGDGTRAAYLLLCMDTIKWAVYYVVSYLILQFLYVKSMFKPCLWHVSTVSIPYLGIIAYLCTVTDSQIWSKGDKFSPFRMNCEVNPTVYNPFGLVSNPKTHDYRGYWVVHPINHLYHIWETLIN